jgi:hypothetical protein
LQAVTESPSSSISKVSKSSEKNLRGIEEPTVVEYSGIETKSQISRIRSRLVSNLFSPYWKMSAVSHKLSLCQLNSLTYLLELGDFML